MGNILVLNMGMKSIRSIIFSPEGEKLASASCPLTTSLGEDLVEQDPVEWWEKARTVVRESLIDVGKEQVEAITVTTSSACLVCVDAAGEALGTCIMVSDKRARHESDWIAALPEFAAVRERTGLGMDSYLMLPKILWIKNHQPERFAQTYKFLSPNDFLLGKMTGKFVTDIFNAQKYHYDMKMSSGGGYPSALLRQMGLSTERLPQVVSPGTVIGTLLPATADDLGLCPATKVVATTYDAICSFFGSGVSEEGDASDVSGTVTVFRALSHKRQLQPNAQIFITPYPQGDLQIVGGSNNLGGGLIEWVKQCYYQNEPYPYEVMEKDAGEARPGAGGVIFLPYLLGERAPIWNPEARGVFFGLERMHTRREMTRAVFESTGFIDQDMIQAIEATGMRIRKIRFSGGLARLNLIAQIKADITGRDIEVLSDFETTATGAAMLAYIGLGRFQNLAEAAKYFAAIRMIIKPDRRNHERYRELYRLYHDVYEKSRDLFRERMDIVQRIYPHHEVRIENL